MSVKSTLKSAFKSAARKMLHNFDFVMAGACLAFALSSRPFLTSFETERLENAKAQYEQVHTQAVAYGAAAGQPDSVLQNSDALNLYIYDQREKDAETRTLSDDYRNARGAFFRAQRTYNMSSTMGYVFGGTFAALGLATAAAGINNRRPRRKDEGMAM